MTEKAPCPVHVQAHAGSNWAIWNFFSTPGREQCVLMMETARTWLNNGEALQRAVHQALRECQAAAQQPPAANIRVALPSSQPDLLSFYLDGPLQYWQQVTTAGLQAHIEIMACMSHLISGQTAAPLTSPSGSSKAALPASEKALRDKARSLPAQALRPKAHTEATAE